MEHEIESLAVESEPEVIEKPTNVKLNKDGLEPGAPVSFETIMKHAKAQSEMAAKAAEELKSVNKRKRPNKAKS